MEYILSYFAANLFSTFDVILFLLDCDDFRNYYLAVNVGKAYCFLFHNKFHKSIISHNEH